MAQVETRQYDLVILILLVIFCWPAAIIYYFTRPKVVKYESYAPPQQQYAQPQQQYGPPPSGFCPQCGQAVAPNTAFCPHCGKQLK